jgi:translation initiation factor 5B
LQFSSIRGAVKITAGFRLFPRKAEEKYISAAAFLLVMSLRSPICTVVGHVDHGKTTLLDTIRSSAVANQEVGKITQAIGASIIPIATIEKVCGPLFPKQKVNVPGVLFIDTPGHAAFTSLRKRGGSLADVAIVLVDLHEGFKPQTREAVEILKAFKTPFVVAANKLDLSPGYRKHADLVTKDIAAQDAKTNEYIETKVYQLVATLAELGYPSERFDRITDFSKNVAIVPISAITKQGMPELLMVILGLAQKFLEGDLAYTANGPGKGVILEVKEEQGMGKTLDVILYDGKLSVGDSIVVGTLNEPIITKVRALLEPGTNTELRDKKAQFRNIQTAHAAVGVKIVAPGLDDAVAGMPVLAAHDIASVAHEVKAPEVLMEQEQEGIIIKADTIGSIEALFQLCKEKNIPIHRASIGPVSRKDVAEAQTQPDPVVIAFNVAVGAGVDTSGITIIQDTIIYHVLDKYDEHLKEKADAAAVPVRPTKAEILRNHIFRQSNPLICGMHVISGELATGMQLMKDGKQIALVKEIQDNKQNVGKAASGKNVAVSLVGPTAGRQCNEGDILYTAVTEEQFRQLRNAAKHLTESEKQVLREIAEMMRKDSPLWGV